jgi:hypothetical protein
MSMKESQEKIVANMKSWQRVEKLSIGSTGKIIETSDNPVVCLIMEMIQRDSQMHFRVQELIKNSLVKEALTLSPDELAVVWDKIEDHIKLEKETIALAKQSLEETKKSKGMLVQNYLLEYLLKDEEKHDAVLANLEKIKGGMYPYA